MLDDRMRHNRSQTQRFHLPTSPWVNRIVGLCANDYHEIIHCTGWKNLEYITFKHDNQELRVSAFFLNRISHKIASNIRSTKALTKNTR